MTQESIEKKETEIMPKPDGEVKAKAEKKSRPKAEVKTEAEGAAPPESTAKPKTRPKAKAEDKVPAETKAESEGEAKPKARAKAKPEVKAEAAAAAETGAKPKARPKGKAVAAAEAKVEEKPAERVPLPPQRLKQRYHQEIVPALMKELGIKRAIEIARLKKIVLNMGLGEAIQNPKALESAERDLVAITGQHPVTTRSKKSISAFKLRVNMPIGMKVTLRGRRMWDFMDKLVNAVLPRIRDFQGLSPNSFDGRGAYNLGLKEQIIFPEIEYDKVDKVRGMQITIVTSARNDQQARRLLENLGMLFSK